MALDFHMQDDAANTLVDDSSPTNIDGVASANTNTLSVPGTGQYPRALGFDGSQFINVSSRSLAREVPWSFLFFLKRASTLNSDGIFGDPDGQATLEFEGDALRLTDEEGTPSTLANVGSTTTWQHWALVNSGFSDGVVPPIKVYRDAQLIGEIGPLTADNCRPTHLARGNGDLNYFLTGALLRVVRYDEVRTQPQIQADKEIGLPSARPRFPMGIITGAIRPAICGAFAWLEEDED